ncbi:MAG: cysteine desulfurase family protein [Candidatus Binataceae bacterium]
MELPIQMRIYLDHNAGTPLRPVVRAAMASFADDANPAAVHRAGQRARRALEQAREAVAHLIEAPARAMVFISGGTEANNLAIFGIAGAASTARRKVVSSAIEHSSVMAPLAELEGRGFEVVRVAPDRDGRVASAKVAAALDRDTALVTLALANAEVGTIQELNEVAQAAAAVGAMFHIDAAQAVGRIPVRVDEPRCDLLTLSAHKIGGPAGIGALYVREGVNLAPVMLGGPQENALRAGTPNLIGAIGFAAAAEETHARFTNETGRIAQLTDTLRKRLMASIPGLRLNGPITGRIPNTLNLAFPGVLGESLLIALDLEGVEASMGSACAAGAVEPSHVLLAMGRSIGEARSSLRISLGWSNTGAEIALASEIIPRVWRRVSAAEPVGDADGLTSASGAAGEEAPR